jgi:hypothetical protein
MVNPKHTPFTTTLDFIKENYGHYKLSFFQLQNNRAYFIYEDHIGYIRAEVSTDSTIITPQIDFNTPGIIWNAIEVFINEDDNITASWVCNDYKWS